MLSIVTDIELFLSKSKCCTATAAAEFADSSQSGKLSQIQKVKRVRNNIYRIYALESGFYPTNGCLTNSQAITIGDLIDCGCCDEDTTTLDGDCDLNGLGIGWCYNSGPPQTVDIIVADGSVSDSSYENYYYEHYIGTSDSGPWSLASPSNTNIARIDLEEFSAGALWTRTVVKCSEDSNYFIEFIAPYRDVNSLSIDSFGYYTYPGQPTPIEIPYIWPMPDDQVINIINLNDDFIITDIENVTTSTSLGGPSNNISIDLSLGGISDFDVININFSYVKDPSAFSCQLQKVCTARVVPQPIIVSNETFPGVVCPGDTVTLSISNYPFDSYLWSNGATTSSINITSGGTYTCTCTFMNLVFTATTSLISGSPTATPILVDDATGLEIDAPISAPVVLCPPNSIDIKVSDAGIYSGGFPPGTTFEWQDDLGGIIVPPGLIDVVNSSSGSSFKCIVYIPGECPVETDFSYVITQSLAQVPTITSAPFCRPTDGEVSISLTPGVPAPPYRYLWTADLAQTNVIQDTTTAATTDSITGLSAGTYYLDITDNNGCSTGPIPYVVPGSSALSLTMSKTDVTCNGLSDGTATVSVSGGTAPYTYLWSNAQTVDTIAGLSAGTYSVTVTDADGCTDTDSVVVTEPAAISAILSNPSGLNLTAVISGGTTPYTVVEWYDLVPNLIGTGTSVTAPGPGTYQLYVQDTNGCDNSASIPTITI
jgi:hypothetical protein